MRELLRDRLHKNSIFCTKSSPLVELYVQSPGQVRRCAAEEPDHWHRGSLRARRARPRHRAAEKRDELAPPHSITSSAMLSSDGGTVRPSIRAVWALMTSSNLVDCSTGRSAGLAPLRMRPV